MASAAILTGIALAGSIIPFFIATTHPLLMWLGNPIVLGALVLFSAILWTAIYGLDINKILTEQYWNHHAKEPIHVLYATIHYHTTKFHDLSFDGTLSSEHAAVIHKRMTIKGHQNIQKIAKDLRDYIDNTNIEISTSMNSLLQTLQEQEAVKPSDETTPLTPTLQRLALNDRYPIRTVATLFNIIGWINAFLVNSVGVAVSALSIIAFIFDSLYKMGILHSAIIPMGIAIPVTIACFFAGATAAFMITRVRTIKVGEDLAYKCCGWIDQMTTSNKALDDTPWLSKATAIKITAITISLIVGLGFAGFNYYTGYYFGSMLVELFLGNPSSLINPSAILDATFSHTVLGTCFGLLGFALTIISTSSFMYETIFKFLQAPPSESPKDESWVSYLQSFGPLLRQGVVMTTPIAVIAMLVCSFSIPQLSILSAYSALGLFLIVSNIHEAKADVQSLPKVIVIMIMSFAMAAMAGLGTLKVGSFWYNYLPAALATTSMLNIYGLVVFIAAMVAFPAVFNGAITDVMATVMAPNKPLTACDIKVNTTVSSSKPSEWVDELLTSNNVTVKPQ